jgi:hypothetical protein
VAAETSGGGDEMGREETRGDGQRREGRDERASATKMKWELGNLNLKDLRWFIYIIKTASFWAFINAQNDAL